MRVNDEEWKADAFVASRWPETLETHVPAPQRLIAHTANQRLKHPSSEQTKSRCLDLHGKPCDLTRLVRRVPTGEKWMTHGEINLMGCGEKENRLGLSTTTCQMFLSVKEQTSFGIHLDKYMIQDHHSLAPGLITAVCSHISISSSFV